MQHVPKSTSERLSARLSSALDGHTQPLARMSRMDPPRLGLQLVHLVAYFAGLYTSERQRWSSCYDLATVCSE
eukprot:4090898-Heterocapsa_arctica.AAC.1